MLKNSFIFLKKISLKKERSIWNQGINSWNEFLLTNKIKGISTKTKQNYSNLIQKAKTAYENEDMSYFYINFPLKEHWRFYRDFKNNAAFLDIEASSVKNGYVTCLTIYDGNETKTFVRGINFDNQVIGKILKNFQMIVTFNGNTFDLPFLKKLYPGMLPEIPCWDLRHSCAALGLKGSLKDIEKTLNIKRTNEIVDNMHDGDPFELWKTFHATGDDYFLNILIEYNQEDTINLKFIADKIYPMLVNKRFNNE